MKTRAASQIVFALLLSLGGCSVGSANNPSAAAAAITPLASPQKVHAFAKTCSQIQLSTEALEYCFADPAHQAERGANEVTLVYYFHGLGGTASDLFEGSDRPILDAAILSFGLRAPIVASLSVGTAGVFADDTSEIFARGLPAIEDTIAPGKTIRRIFMGGSMGGHNALRLAAQAGTAGVSSVAALCPALATFNGYHDDEVAAYRARHADVLDNELFDRAIALFKQRITTADAWDANNTFTFLDRGAYDGIPIFMSVGTSDSLGFFEGTREFVRRAALRPAMSVDYHEAPGGHCSFDIPALVRFLDAHI